MSYYRDDTAETAITNADADLQAERVVKEILRYAKGHGFIFQDKIMIMHKVTGRKYTRYFNIRKR